jgi:hypothetical protein
MAMSNGKFGVCVVSAFLAAMVLFSGGRRQSQAETASGKNQSEAAYVYPADVKPECRAKYDLAWRIDWNYEPFDYGEAETVAKQIYRICDTAKADAEAKASMAAQSIAGARANAEVRRQAGSQ